MNRSPRRTATSSFLLLAILAAPATAQQFQAGAVYLIGPALHLPPNQTYAGIRRVDLATGITTPFVAYQSGGAIDPGGATYDPFRDRIVTTGQAPLGFSYGPQGAVVLAAAANTSGGLARFLRIDPVTAVATPFATVAYTGDIGFSCGTYCPTIGKALTLDGSNDVFRSWSQGEVGGGTVFGGFGSPFFGGASETLFVVGPIGPSATLKADTCGLSTSAGGVQHLTFTPGQSHAGDLYWILGSISGWAPGFALGNLTMPLNWDVYTNLTVSNPNSAFLVNTLGSIGATGQSTAQIVLPAGVLTALQGVTVLHAGLVANSSLQFTHVSNPVPLALLP